MEIMVFASVILFLLTFFNVMVALGAHQCDGGFGCIMLAVAGRDHY